MLKVCFINGLEKYSLFLKSLLKYSDISKNK